MQNKIFTNQVNSDIQLNKAPLNEKKLKNPEKKVKYFLDMYT